MVFIIKTALADKIASNKFELIFYKYLPYAAGIIIWMLNSFLY